MAATTKTEQTQVIDYSDEAQLLKSLDESVVVSWFSQKIITSGVVAERLLRERHAAADCIRKLRAELNAAGLSSP